MTGTGICVIDDDNQIISAGSISVGRLRGLKRINFVIDAITNSFLLHPVVEQKIQEGHDLVVVREGYSYSSSSNSAYEIGELGGCINRHFFHFSTQCNGMSYRVIPPTTMKKFSMGRGDVAKGQTAESKAKYLAEVFEHTGIQFPDDNQADAYLLAMTIKKMLEISRDPNLVQHMSKAQRECSISPALARKKKLTPGKLNKLDDDEFSALMAESLEYSTIKVF